MQTDSKIADLEEIRVLASELYSHEILYLYFLIFFRRPEAEQAQLRKLIQSQTHDKEVESFIMTGAEALIQRSEKRGEKRGIEQGIKQGEKRGQIQAKREFLLKLLDLRIGEVPETVVNKISRMRSHIRLDGLLEQAAIATTLDDIEWN